MHGWQILHNPGGYVWVMSEWSVDSGSHKLSENVWFVWSKTSYSGDVTDAGRTNKQTMTSEYRATQLLICEKLSLTMILHRKPVMWKSLDIGWNRWAVLHRRRLGGLGGSTFCKGALS